MNTDTFFTTGTTIIRQAVQADSLEDFERALQLYIKGINYYVKGLKYLTPGSTQKHLYSNKCNEYMVRAETIKTALKERNNNGAESSSAPSNASNGNDSEKSRLRSGLLSSVIKQGEVNVKWDDIAGLDQAKTILKEALVYPKLYPDMDIVAWKGILFYGSGGTGKCLSELTPVLLFDGSVKFAKDIITEDILMGDDSLPRKVLSVAAGEDEMYEVVPNKGRSYTVNKSHILTLKGYDPSICQALKRGIKRWYVRWSEQGTCTSRLCDSEEKAKEFLQTYQFPSPIFDIPLEDYLKKTKAWKSNVYTYHVGVEFAQRTVPLDPYLLGYWLGDGTSATCEITTADPEILEIFNEKLFQYDLRLNAQGRYRYGIKNIANSKNLSSGNTSGYNGMRKGSNNGWIVTFNCENSSTGSRQKHFKDKSEAIEFLQTQEIRIPLLQINPFLNKLRQLNVVNNKHIPFIYKANSRENRLQLLAGLLDSDGYTDTHYIEIIQKRKQLADDIEYLALSLGFMATNKKVFKTCTNSINGPVTGEYHRINIFGEGIEDIPSILARKKCKIRNHYKNATKQGFSVKSIGIGKYNGFIIDGNRRFLLGDFTVTHNTHLARCVATELKSFFLSISSSDLVSKWHGESEKLIAELFDLARSNKPSIIFIDEIDSLCSSRGDGDSNDITNARIVTKFLYEMDGMGKDNTDVTFIGATNRPWVLDDAMRRRFEKRIYIPLPDLKAREDLFRLKLKAKKITLSDVQFLELATLTDGYSGADLDILIRDVCMTPMRRLSKAVYFKKDDQGYDAPCQSTDLGAEKKNLSMGGLKIDNTIKYEYFILSLEKVKPSVSQHDLERFVNWTDQFGESGN